MRAAEVDKFFSCVIRGEDCWGWRGLIDPQGRARFTVSSKPHLAHRVSYEIAHGEIPSGACIVRICASLLCVRPDHLRAGLQRNNKRSIVERFWEKVRKSDSCWEWIGSKNKRGYGQIFSQTGKRPELAHRVSYRLHTGCPTAHVLHRCDNPACVRPDHLFEGTDADNVADMDRKRRRINAGSKLSLNQVTEIRELLSAGHSQAKIAPRFGVSSSTVSRIATGSAWQNP